MNTHYNDESPSYYKLLLTLVDTMEKGCTGSETSKEQITFLTFCNSDGSHKLKFVVTRKAKYPKVLKNLMLLI